MLTNDEFVESDNPQGKEWETIPVYMRGGLNRYLKYGIKPGGFLESLLCNDLFGTFHSADSCNQKRVLDYLQFLYMHAPSESWGSRERYVAWLKRGGTTGETIDT
jgi:hypothetical protein